MLSLTFLFMFLLKTSYNGTKLRFVRTHRYFFKVCLTNLKERKGVMIMKIMKGFFPIAVVGLLLSLGACTGPNDGGKSGQTTTSSVAPLPRITVKTADDKTSLTLIVGETGQVKADQEGVTWASTNAAVATVENGVVTAVAPGSAKITASKDGFKTGELNVTVNRKPPIATLHFEVADHYSADGEWTNSNRGPGVTPIYEKSSASDGTCVGYFGDGDKETLTFTSSAAINAELLITMGHNSSYEPLSEIMSAKLNDADIDLSKVNFTSDSDGSGNYTFIGVSFGKFDLVQGNNVLEISMKGNAPYLDDLLVYSDTAAEVTAVPAPEKPAITVQNAEAELTIEAESTVQLRVDVEGVKYRSNSESVATVDENTGLVTGVAKGNTDIVITKDGYKTAKAHIIVTEKVVAGEIRAQAEDGTCNDAAIAEADTPIVKRSTSTGETCTAQWAAEAVLVIKFNAANAGSYKMYLNGRAGGQYGTANIDNLKAVIEVKVNNAAVAIADDFAISGRTFTDYLLGDVTLKAGENTIEVKAIGEENTAPNIDFFKFVPNA